MHRAQAQSDAYEKSNKSKEDLIGMGKTVPSYRMTLEVEIDRWRGFVRVCGLRKR
jgi:hypothetical protein